MVGLLILFTAAGALTSIWIGGALTYINRYLGWDALFTLMPNDLALFAFGVFGPVALLWLVLGLVQMTLSSHRQEGVLRQMVVQERRASDQIEAQVRTLIQMQDESRRRSVIDGMDLVLKDLNGQAAVLAERLGMVSPDEADTLWGRTVAGDVWAFSYAFLTRAAIYDDFPDLLAERLAQDDISSSALQLFLRRYDMLLESFRETNADKLARAVLEDGPLARLHSLFATVNLRAVRLRQGLDYSFDPTQATAATAGYAGADSAAAPQEDYEPSSYDVPPYLAAAYQHSARPAQGEDDEAFPLAYQPEDLGELPQAEPPTSLHEGYAADAVDTPPSQARYDEDLGVYGYRNSLRTTPLPPVDPLNPGPLCPADPYSDPRPVFAGYEQEGGIVAADLSDDETQALQAQLDLQAEDGFGDEMAAPQEQQDFVGDDGRGAYEETARIAAAAAAAAQEIAARLEAERLDAEQLAAEQAEAERLDAERRAAEQAEAERLAAEQAEAERLDAERRAAEQAEAERLAAEQAEAERLDAERRAAEQAEAERLAAEQAEAERLDAERRAAEQAEAERLAAEQAEAERLDAERRAAEQAEAERLAAEQAEAERLDAERRAAEQAEAERLAAEQAEAERLDAERRAAEQAEAERLAAEQAEAERLDAERRAAEQAEAERLESERRAAEQEEFARLETERRASEQAEIERLEAERRYAESLEAEQAEYERYEAERRAAEQALADQAASQVHQPEESNGDDEQLAEHASLQANRAAIEAQMAAAEGMADQAEQILDDEDDDDDLLVLGDPSESFDLGDLDLSAMEQSIAQSLAEMPTTAPRADADGSSLKTSAAEATADVGEEDRSMEFSMARLQELLRQMDEPVPPPSSDGRKG